MQGITESGRAMLEHILKAQNLDDFREQHWSGSFADYLALVRRAIVAALQASQAEESAGEDARTVIEDIVDQELDPYVAEHLSMCP